MTDTSNTAIYKVHVDKESRTVSVLEWHGLSHVRKIASFESSAYMGLKEATKFARRFSKLLNGEPTDAK